jgi:hypothetical protein
MRGKNSLENIIDPNMRGKKQKIFVENAGKEKKTVIALFRDVSVSNLKVDNFSRKIERKANHTNLL